MTWQHTKSVMRLGDLFLEMQELDKQHISYAVYAVRDSNIYQISWNDRLVTANT